MLRLTSAINYVNRAVLYNLKYKSRLYLSLHKCASFIQTMSTSTGVPCKVSSFNVQEDTYQGVKVNSDLEPERSLTEFADLLRDSLKLWKEKGVRGVWFKVGLAHSDWIPTLAKNGFYYHHARKDFVMMITWLAVGKCTIPPYPHTFLGVGAVVINKKNEILVIKEKRPLVRKIWKFPGGYAEKGEDFGDAARREVKEETGIDCDFVSVISLRHVHEHQFDCADIHIVCHMQPVNYDISICEVEIDQCCWMKIEEYLVHDEVTEFCKFVLKSHLSNQQRGLALKEAQVPSIFKKKVNKIFHINSEEKS